MLRWFFPPEGGGRLRRFFQFRKEMLVRVLTSKDRYPCPPITLFDFRQHDDAVDAAKVTTKKGDCWRISDDSVIGGFSNSRAVFIQSPEDCEQFSADNEKPPDFIPSLSTPTVDSTFVPFLRWYGTVDTTVGLRSSAVRSGFAALRSPIFPFAGANLRGLYSALEIVCRSDDRLYTVNLKVDSTIPDDIYQGQITSSSPAYDEKKNLTGSFNVFVIPFAELKPFSMGGKGDFDRVLDNQIRIESIGITLMDGKDGKFQFDLARIRAVNFLDDGQIFEREPVDTKQ